MKIYIVRHGETEYNTKGLLQGSTDVELNQDGIDLAIETGVGLKDIKFDVCYSSPLKRAYDTAKLILKENNYKDTKIIIDKRIAEVNMGVWEGKSVKGMDKYLSPEDLDAFFNNPFLLDEFPGGESAKIVAKRSQEFLFELVKNHDYDNVLVATHGFALRALLNFMYEDKSDFWQGQVPYNCSVNIIEYKDGKFSFVSKDKIYYDKNRIVDRYKKN